MRCACLTVCLMLVGMTGCADVMNAVIPAHPHSLAPTTGTSLYIHEKEAGVAVASARDEAVSFFYDALQKALEDESKRYEATDSARGSGKLINGGGLIFARSSTKSGHEALPVTRGVVVGKSNDNVAPFPNGVTTVFEAKFEDAGDGGIRIVPTHFMMKRAKAKVPVAHGHSLARPWQWPVALYLLFKGGDESPVGSVDVNLQITIQEASGAKPQLQLGKTAVHTVDFPLGKIKMSDLESTNGAVLNIARLEKSRSRILPINTGSSVNITVTLVESNELGDIIGKEAQRLKDNKDDYLKRIIRSDD